MHLNYLFATTDQAKYSFQSQCWTRCAKKHTLCYKPTFGRHPSYIVIDSSLNSLLPSWKLITRATSNFHWSRRAFRVLSPRFAARPKDNRNKSKPSYFLTQHFFFPRDGMSVIVRIICCKITFWYSLLIWNDLCFLLSRSSRWRLLQLSFYWCCFQCQWPGCGKAFIRIQITMKTTTKTR